MDKLNNMNDVYYMANFVDISSHPIFIFIKLVFRFGDVLHKTKQERLSQPSIYALNKN